MTYMKMGLRFLFIIANRETNICTKQPIFFTALQGFPYKEYWSAPGTARIPGASFFADGPSAAAGEYNPGASDPGVS